MAVHLKVKTENLIQNAGVISAIGVCNSTPTSWDSGVFPNDVAQPIYMDNIEFDGISTFHGEFYVPLDASTFSMYVGNMNNAYPAGAASSATIWVGEAILVDIDDPLRPSAAQSISLTAIEKSLGSVPRSSGKFTITGLSGLTTNKPVTITQAVGPYTGKGTRADEAEMDGLTVSASVTSATEITAYWNSARRVKGNFKFNYFVGA